MSSRESRVEGREPEGGQRTLEAEPHGAFWPLALLLILAGATLVALQMRRPERPGPFDGLPLPPLDAAGWLNTARPLSADDLRGKVVLLDFWATNCGPCLQHMPELVAFHERFGGRGVAVVGLTLEPPRMAERVKRVVETMGMEWPIGMGTNMAYQVLDIPGTPTYVLYDRTGRSVWSGHTLDGLEDATIAALAKK